MPNSPHRHMGLAIAASALLGMHGSFTPPEVYADHFRRRERTGPTNKRAKVKAGRKANVDRIRREH